MDAAGTGANHCPQGVGIVTANTGWWTSTASINVASSNTDVMNQLCRVCGEPAAGFHFGAFTCEGCKSFFGRTYNNLGSISECKNGGVCVINKKNRTACKACRLRKCLVVGMSKSGSRYGRRSNWFKIHCLLQEQSHQAQTRLKDPKVLYDKAFSSLDVANNNSNNNNNENNVTSGSNVTVPNSIQDRLLSKKDETSRSQDLGTLRTLEVPRSQDMIRPPDMLRTHDLLRPENRFPMWRGPFFHPALTQMQLLNANPFFPFQQRFIVPYMNQVNVTPQPAVFSSSSDSASSRSTPSPKQDKDSSQQDPQQNPGRYAEDEVISDKSVAFLRSLGPEQEEPIDLSTKHPEECCDRQLEEQNELLNENNDLSEIQTGAPPLDLTRKT